MPKLIGMNTKSKNQALQVDKKPATGSLPPNKLSQATMIVMGLANLVLVVALIIFLVTQFSPKSVKNIEWENYVPLLNVYPDATLLANDSNINDSYKHIWQLYASKDDLGKIKQYYQDQILGIGYKQETNNSLFPLAFYKTESNGCLDVRYNLDVVSLDENTIELSGVDAQTLKGRYPGQTLFVVHQLDAVSREPTC
jgi:hypothetical protein